MTRPPVWGSASSLLWKYIVSRCKGLSFASLLVPFSLPSCYATLSYYDDDITPGLIVLFSHQTQYIIDYSRLPSGKIETFVCVYVLRCYRVGVITLCKYVHDSEMGVMQKCSRVRNE